MNHLVIKKKRSKKWAPKLTCIVSPPFLDADDVMHKDGGEIMFFDDSSCYVMTHNSIKHTDTTIILIFKTLKDLFDYTRMAKINRDWDVKVKFKFFVDMKRDNSSPTPSSADRGWHLLKFSILIPESRLSAITLPSNIRNRDWHCGGLKNPLH